MLNTLLEISIRGIQLLSEQHWSTTHVAPRFPKNRHLGLQNGSRSSGPEKLLKIVSCAENEKLKELMVGVQMEYVGGHQYPRGPLGHPKGSRSS